MLWRCLMKCKLQLLHCASLLLVTIILNQILRYSIFLNNSLNLHIKRCYLDNNAVVLRKMRTKKTSEQFCLNIHLCILRILSYIISTSLKEINPVQNSRTKLLFRFNIILHYLPLINAQMVLFVILNFKTWTSLSLKLFY